MPDIDPGRRKPNDDQDLESPWFQPSSLKGIAALFLQESKRVNHTSSAACAVAILWPRSKCGVSSNRSQSVLGPRPSTPSPAMGPKEYPCYECEKSVSHRELMASEREKHIKVKESHPDEYNEYHRICAECEAKERVQDILHCPNQSYRNAHPRGE